MKPPIIFLDTNVILDYLEKRDQEVEKMVSQLLLFHGKGRLILATSVFNVSELIDNEFQIQVIGECINERMSYDEINRFRSNKNEYRVKAEKNRFKVEKKIKDFIFRNRIEVLSIPFDEPEYYQELYELIYKYQLRSQDALMVATASLNDATYFLSKDSDLINTIGDLFNTFDLRIASRLEGFRNEVLEALL